MSILEQMAMDQDDLGINQDQLEGLTTNIKLLITKQDELNDLMAKAKAKEQEISDLEQKSIPDLMTAMGITGFDLEDCRKLTCNRMYFASISEVNRPRAWGWLKSNDHDDIIKNVLTLTFGKGEDEQASQAINSIKKLGYVPSQERRIHGQTLKAFVKEMAEEGDPVPDVEESGITVHMGYKVKIK